MSTVTISFADRDTAEIWHKATRDVRKDDRGYSCIYLDTNDEGAMVAIRKAKELGGKVE